MTSFQHAVTHANADARAAAVLATREADAAGQAPQLRAAALSDMARLRSCAGALASAWLTFQPGLTELTAVDSRTIARLRLGEDLFPGQDGDMVRVRPRHDSEGDPSPGLRCSVAHGRGGGSSQAYHLQYCAACGLKANGDRPAGLGWWRAQRWCGVTFSAWLFRGGEPAGRGAARVGPQHGDTVGAASHVEAVVFECSARPAGSAEMSEAPPTQ